MIESATGDLLAAPTAALVNAVNTVEAGLPPLVAAIQSRRIRSIAIPALGCGLGGLQWEDVRPRIEAAFAPLADVRILLYAPVIPLSPQH